MFVSRKNIPEMPDHVVFCSMLLWGSLKTTFETSDLPTQTSNGGANPVSGNPQKIARKTSLKGSWRRDLPPSVCDGPW